MQYLLRSVLSLCFLLSLTTAHSQALHIYYDVHGKEVTYVVAGDTIDSPLVKHRSDVFFHLENLNTYRFAVEVKQREDKDAVGASGGSTNLFSSLMPGGGSPFPGGMSGLLGNLTGESSLEYNHLTSEGEERAFAVESAEAEALGYVREAYETLLYDMAETESSIEKANQALNASLDQRKYVVLARRELKRLKFRTDLQPAQIQDLSATFIKKALGDQPEKVDVLTVAETRAAQLQKDAGKLSKYLAQYESQLQILSQLKQQMEATAVSPDHPLYQKLTTSTENTYAKAIAFSDAAKNNRSLAAKTIQDNQDRFTSELIDLRYEIESLRANNFSHTERYTADGGPFSLQATLFPLDTNGNRMGGPPVNLSPIRVSVKGGLRVSSSVGLSLGQYFNAPQEYLLREGVVIGAEKDKFLPIMNTMLHFHSYSERGVVLGGTFGVGLPLTSSDAARSTTFLLGPSLVMGGKDKLFLTAG
ncbi:MAG: hypothetical protein AAGF89_09720, partial [Bacteroidota bacterium]